MFLSDCPKYITIIVYHSVYYYSYFRLFLVQAQAKLMQTFLFIHLLQNTIKRIDQDYWESKDEESFQEIKPGRCPAGVKELEVITHLQDTKTHLSNFTYLLPT